MKTTYKIKAKKGLSSIMGTVIVLAITIALGALLYAYANGLFGILTQNVSVTAQAQIIVNPSTGVAYLEYSLTNNGNLRVTVTEISVNGNVVNNTAITLIPGQTYSYVQVLPSSLGVQAGEYYTVIFMGLTSTEKPFSITLNVLASSAA